MTINQSTKPEDVISTTQSLRLEVVTKLVGEGENRSVPTEAKELASFLQVLRDLDAAALTTRKLDVEEKGVDVASKASANVTAILQAMGGNPFKRVESDVVATQSPTVDISQLPVIEQVPGQTKQGEDKLVYEEFVYDEDHTSES